MVLDKKSILYGVVGGAATVASVPLIVGGLGFTAAGIAAGSYAAGMMSSAAVAGGGGVVAGSTVAILQSVGAAGLGLAGKVVIGTTGAAATTGIVSIFQKPEETKVEDIGNTDHMAKLQNIGAAGLALTGKTMSVVGEKSAAVTSTISSWFW